MKNYEVKYVSKEVFDIFWGSTSTYIVERNVDALIHVHYIA